MLEHGHARNVERVGVTPRRIVERHAREVALNVAGDAVVEVFVIPSRPFANETYLREYDARPEELSARTERRDVPALNQRSRRARCPNRIRPRV